MPTLRWLFDKAKLDLYVPVGPTESCAKLNGLGGAGSLQSAWRGLSDHRSCMIKLPHTST